MWRLAASLAMAAWITAGCGPVHTTQAVSLAQREIAAAQAEHADVASPYEFESALLYLDRAREREGRADFAQARDWAKMAAAFAAEARTKAAENLRQKEVRERSKAQATGAPAPGDNAPPSEGDVP